MVFVRNSMNKIRELPKASARILYSEQIITSVFSVVKELLENALDSQSKNVEIKLEEYGIEKIEVKDNGSGIFKGDIPYVAKPHFTSKISSHSDLNNLETYGFRGEALGAICAVADLEIVTKTAEDSFATCYKFNSQGNVSSSVASPCPQGTVVCVQNLFKNFPVRKQFYRSLKNKKDELKKIEDLLIAFGCVQYGVRIAFYHNRNLLWQKPAMNSVKEAMIHILGRTVVDNLEYLNCIDDKCNINIEIYLPKLNVSFSNSTPSKSIVAVNNRPVRIKEIDKLLKQYYSKSIDCSNKGKYPTCCVFITVPLSEVDVNIEPNKTAVMLHNSNLVLKHLNNELKKYYEGDSGDVNAKDTVNAKKDDCFKAVQTANTVSNAEKSSNFIENNVLRQNVTTFKAPAIILPENKSNKLLESTLIINKSEKILKENSELSCKTKAILKSNLNTNQTSSSANLCFSKEKKNFLINDDAQTAFKKPRLSLPKSNDVYNHLKTLNEFFSSNESSFQERTVLLPAKVPSMSVTAQRSSSVEDVRVQILDSDQAEMHKSTLKRKRRLSDSCILLSQNSEINKDTSAQISKKPTWSKGYHLSGDNIQPVTVLKPKVIDLDDKRKTPSRQEELPKKDSSVIERKLTPFDFFCRRYRLEVAAQNPDFNNHQIAQMLTKKWSSLSPYDKAIYNNMIDKDYPKKVKEKSKLGNKISQNLKKLAPCSSKGEEKQIKKRREMKITFDIKNLESSVKNRIESLDNPGMKAINHLSSGVWVCSKNKKLFLLNASRLQETVIYYRLLETFHFEIAPVDPIFVSNLDAGSELLNILNLNSSMKNIDESVLDERLSANGFKVQCIKKDDNVMFKIIGITQSIAFYGEDDFKEIVHLLKMKGSSAKISDCRPGRVLLYLQGEAIRIARRSLAIERLSDLEDLLKQQKYIPPNSETCMHHKPFFHELWQSPVESSI